ncbi:MAG: alanine racemase [Nocardioides sp.]|uniref:alanine racemase n=1 Tax=Nocardioides sp. TaxID=35761 RepID=UPI003F054C83
MSPSVPPRAEIEVDLAAVRHNVRLLAQIAAGTGAAFMAVVKADAYGHGMVEVARAAREAGAPWLGVATPEEALALREAGDTGRLLCWLSAPGDDLAPVVARGVDVSAYTVEALDALAVTGGARVHLKVDTGLSRGGAVRDDWPAFFARAASLQAEGQLQVVGLWSHLVASDEPDSAVNDAQEQVFRDAAAMATAAGLTGLVKHLANSAAILSRPSVHFDLVRGGIATYGLAPAPGVIADPGLVPAMTVRGRLAMSKQIRAGDGVSYGHQWVAAHDTTVGLVPAGYGDGIPRSASNRAEVQVAGARRPMRGKVCMDQFVVDLDGEAVPAGTEVVLFGTGAHGEPTAQDWAEAAGTINYEIVTRIGGRFVRRHVDSDAGAGARTEEQP